MSEKKRRPRKKLFKPVEPVHETLPIESNEYFSFIAGYTSGGAAYGLTWEEYNPYDENSARNNMAIEEPEEE
jgi:hypothetical protein